MIVSSEFDKTDDEIIDIYGGLWRIEETLNGNKYYKNITEILNLCYKV